MRKINWYVSLSISVSLTIVIGGTFSACNYFTNGNANNNTAVARVYNKYLYLEDLEALVGNNNSPEDSIDIINHYIDEWIRKQLLLQEAEQLLSDNQKDIEKQLNDYRESLLLFSFEQELLKQINDTTVSKEEVKAYIAANQNNFELRDNVLKIQYIVLDKQHARLDSVKVWLSDSTQQVQQKLTEFCEANSSNYMLSPQWYTLQQLAEELPIDKSKPAKLLQKNKLHQTSDAVNKYFIKVLDFGQQGKTAPFDYKKKEVEKIILNKKKLEYVNKVKEQTYKQSINNNEVEVYIEIE